MTKLKLRKGSSSLLVILLVVTMVVFGVLAMMSSYSGLKMAKKNAQWTSEYYELEANAEILVYDIKNILQESVSKTNLSEQEYWAEINNKLEQMANSEVTINARNNGITVVGDFKNENGDRFVAELIVKYPNLLASDEKLSFKDSSNLLDIKKWQLVPRDVEYDNIIEFKDLEVDIEND